MDREQEEKIRIEIERQHYADWLARAEPRQRCSVNYQKKAKAAAFAYARDAKISPTPGPAEASLSEVECSAVSAAVANEGDEIELTRKFPNRCASRIARRKFGSWRRRPSKIAARKFLNRQMCVKNRPKKIGWLDL